MNLLLEGLAVMDQILQDFAHLQSIIMINRMRFAILDKKACQELRVLFNLFTNGLDGARSFLPMAADDVLQEKFDLDLALKWNLMLGQTFLDPRINRQKRKDSRDIRNALKHVLEVLAPRASFPGQSQMLDLFEKELKKLGVSSEIAKTALFTAGEELSRLSSSSSLGQPSFFQRVLPKKVLSQPSSYEQMVLGQEIYDMLISMANLTSARQDQEYWDTAKVLNVEVMMCSKMLGQGHPYTLISMTNLALTYRYRGRWNEAEDLYAQVLETKKKMPEQEHQDTMKIMIGLALTYRDQRRWKEAEELFEHVMIICSRVLGQEHPDTLIIMIHLALTYRKQRWLKQAENLYAQVLETRKKMLGQADPNTMKSMIDLALTYQNQGRWEEAKEVFERVMKMSSKVLGQEYPLTLISMTNLAVMYRNKRRWKEAEDLLKHVMRVCYRVLGQEHPHTLINMINLMLTYRCQRRWKEAEDLYAQIIGTQRKILGQNHPDTMKSMTDLAFIYKYRDCNGEAFLELMKECFGLRKVELDLVYPETMSSFKKVLNPWRMRDSAGAHDGLYGNNPWPAFPEENQNTLETRLESHVNINVQVGLHGNAFETTATLTGKSLVVKRSSKKDVESLEVDDPSRVRNEKTTLTQSDTSKPMISARKRFIQNPQHYWRRIDRLEIHVFDAGKEMFQSRDPWSHENGVTIYKLSLALTLPPTPTAINDFCQKLSDQIQQDLKVISGIIKSLDTFAKTGFSRNLYNIIVQDPQRDWVLRVIPITTENLCILQGLLQAGVDTIYAFSNGTEVGWSIVHDAMTDLSQGASLILQHLGLYLPDRSFVKDGRQKIIFYVNRVSYITSILFLGLISFIKSHVGNFDETLLGQNVDDILIDTGCGLIHFRRHHLACLDLFVKAPVWIFTTASMESMVDGLYLSTRLVDFVDLWGPVDLAYTDEEYDHVSEVIVSGGSIRRSRSFPPGTILPEETLCHWYSWTDPELPNDQDIEHSFPTTQLLLIGARTSLSTSSSSVSFRVKDSCSCEHK